MDRRNDIGYLAKAIADARDTSENRMLKGYGITATQMHTLLCIYDAPGHKRSLKEIEQYLYLSQSTIAKLVKTLVREKKLVRYEEDPDDRRVKKAALTAEGIAMCRKTEKIVTEMEHRLCSRLTEQETVSLKELLQRVYKGVSES